MPAFINVLMLIPFGISTLLFQVWFKKTILLTASLVSFGVDPVIRSLFSVSGPYRLADVDDIIQNTTGGGVGYLLGWFLVWLLPIRDEIDEHSFRVGTKVSGSGWVLPS